MIYEGLGIMIPIYMTYIHDATAMTLNDSYKDEQEHQLYSNYRCIN